MAKTMCWCGHVESEHSVSEVPCCGTGFDCTETSLFCEGCSPVTTDHDPFHLIDTLKPIPLVRSG